MIRGQQKGVEGLTLESSKEEARGARDKGKGGGESTGSLSRKEQMTYIHVLNLRLGMEVM